MDIEDIRNEAQFQEEIRRMRQNLERRKNDREYWSTEAAEKLRQLFNEGVGISMIAVQLDRTERAVIQKINKEKLYGTVNTPRGGRQEDLCLCKKCSVRNDCVNCMCKENDHV